MSRKEEFSGSLNPATKFIEWKSNDKQFVFYDKNEKKNKPVPFPVKFAFLKSFNTIKGFSEKLEAGITSNEVDRLGREKLKVVAWQNGKPIEIAEGLYAEIKEKIIYNGGKFTKSIYAEMEGEIVNFQLNGSGIVNYFQFVKKYGNLLIDHYVLVRSFSEEKKGNVIYFSPIFELGEKIEDKKLLKLEKMYDNIVDYYRNYKKNQRGEKNEIEIDTPEELDGLPF